MTAMDDCEPPLFHTNRTQRDDPNVSSTSGHQYTRETLRLGTMRCRPMTPSTFLVRTARFDAAAFCIQTARLLGCVPLRHHIQRVLLAFGPTTDAHDRTICLTWKAPLLARDPGARLAPHPQRIEAKGLAVPRRRHGHARATPRGPSGLCKRVLKVHAIACALTKEHHGGALGDQLLPLLDQGEREVFRTMALLAVADAPSPWQRAACVDYVEHQRHTPTAHDAAIDDEHERLQGQLCQSYLRVRYNRDLFCAPVVAPPPGKALTPTLGLCPVRDVRSHVGQWRTLASYDAADQRGEGRHVPGDRACWLARIPWCEGVPYGTRPAEVVTHRLLLLDWLLSLDGVYDESTSSVLISKRLSKSVR